jgi:2-polyprenyl-3-methyl-5-hydroxy-6-metoxy-1,4-benzoquinol methylase
MEHVQSCNMCKWSEADWLFSIENDHIAKRFSLVQCKRCGFVYTEPRPSIEELEDYYPLAYYGMEGRRFRVGLEDLVCFFRRRLANSLERQFPRKGRVLEVGSGRGNLLGELAKRGWDTKGTEFSSHLAEATIRQFGVKVYAVPNLEACSFETGYFDLILCYHVLEHLPNPIETLLEMRRIIKPSGYVVIAVPNFGGLVANLTRSRWFGLDVPRHLSHFTAKTLRLAIEQAGFEIFLHSNFSLEQDVFGFSQSLFNLLGFPFNAFYDLIRCPEARLYRHRGQNENIMQGLFQLFILSFGSVFSLVGLPVTLLAAACGKGGTLKYWLRPR